MAYMQTCTMVDPLMEMPFSAMNFPLEEVANMHTVRLLKIFSKFGMGYVSLMVDKFNLRASKHMRIGERHGRNWTSQLL